MIMDIRNCAFFVCFYTKSQESPPSEESKDDEADEDKKTISTNGE